MYVHNQALTTDTKKKNSVVCNNMTRKIDCGKYARNRKNCAVLFIHRIVKCECHRN